MMLSTASPADLPFIHRIEASQLYPWSEAQLAGCFGEGYRVRLLWLEDEPVGFSICQRVLDESTLFNICVLPEQRGLGLGKVLMKDLVDEARAAGDSALFLEVRAGNAPAIALYQRFGFEEVGRRKHYYPAGSEREDALVMRLELDRV
ncbi:ribosomal protein S18-alanine N-acetyltransferase [Gallaecimonas kandeliae]|uniref:ribosomal protein S18-alanine N-acetyltransferase n=1 Tax=Gallaecimonas kandeliae TaxID=3029055 RepID=UPI0026476EBB|nr:ribosomal protein S18-alanine N-acetyltransferase [Gallaecimonas kandeliae]WKE64938.1 ribosomal protein S18-alanine N-acetyltransferase [Gallaecimonas kandeliae]